MNLEDIKIEKKKEAQMPKWIIGYANRQSHHDLHAWLLGFTFS